MSVVSHPQRAFYSKPGDPCTFCGEPSCPPYVEWLCMHDDYEGSYTLIVCAHCASDMLRGQRRLGRDLKELARGWPSHRV